VRPAVPNEVVNVPLLAMVGVAVIDVPVIAIVMVSPVGNFVMLESASLPET